MGAIKPNLNIDDVRAVKIAGDFVQWTKKHTQAEWNQGVKLPYEVLHDVIGKNRTPLNMMRRACLVKVKNGNRRLGEADTYTLSKPHFLGLLQCLVAVAAQEAATICINLEVELSALESKSKVNAALNGNYFKLSSEVTL